MYRAPSIDDLIAELDRAVKSKAVSLDDMLCLFEAFAIESIYELTQDERVTFLAMLRKRGTHA